MNEEIEYAEMLEIPVSTVSVTEKRRKFRKSKGDLKEKLISRVNKKAQEESEVDRVEERAYFKDALTDRGGEASIEANRPTFTEVEEPIEKEHGAFYAGDPNSPFSEAESEETCYSSFATVLVEDEKETYEEAETNVKRAGGAARRVLGAEFAAACVLCATIFATNVFLPKSGMNTFFRSLSETPTVETQKTYSDFTLKSVVNDFAEVPLTVSETGVLSFCGKCCVYPAVDGEIAWITENANGTYDVKIAHTDDFYGVICGLDDVYYAAGEKVYANIPVGYTRGESDVQVTMYSGDTLLTSFAVDEENGLAWVLS